MKCQMTSIIRRLRVSQQHGRREAMAAMNLKLAAMKLAQVRLARRLGGQVRLVGRLGGSLSGLVDVVKIRTWRPAPRVLELDRRV